MPFRFPESIAKAFSEANLVAGVNSICVLVLDALDAGDQDVHCGRCTVKEANRTADFQEVGKESNSASATRPRSSFQAPISTLGMFPRLAAVSAGRRGCQSRLKMSSKMVSEKVAKKPAMSSNRVISYWLEIQLSRKVFDENEIWAITVDMDSLQHFAHFMTVDQKSSNISELITSEWKKIQPEDSTVTGFNYNKEQVAPDTIGIFSFARDQMD
ncbi:hypothetical protein FB451DRAFT_1191284 [Mycena latifolia]|nr:hypothetical protein FB451DRAFT_1191284 [Mycena latifolia]